MFPIHWIWSILYVTLQLRLSAIWVQFWLWMCCVCGNSSVTFHHALNIFAYAYWGFLFSPARSNETKYSLSGDDVSLSLVYVHKLNLFLRDYYGQTQWNPGLHAILPDAGPRWVYFMLVKFETPNNLFPKRTLILLCEPVVFKQATGILLVLIALQSEVIDAVGIVCLCIMFSF